MRLQTLASARRDTPPPPQEAVVPRVPVVPGVHPHAVQRRSDGPQPAPTSPALPRELLETTEAAYKPALFCALAEPWLSSTDTLRPWTLCSPAPYS